MNKIKGLLEEGIEKVEEGVKTQAKVTAQSAKGQVTGNVSAHSDQGTNEAGQTNPNQQTQSDQKATEDFVKELYAPGNKQQVTSNKNGEEKESSEFFKDQIEEGKTPEEAAKMEALRKKLHDEVYYLPLTQRKPHEVEQKEEEQKEEAKKMEELQKEDEKKKKEQPIAVQMGANRAERFPGASG